MAVALDLRDDPHKWVEIFLLIVFKSFSFQVFILDINMTLGIDFHVLVLQMLMDNK